jgi:hypothetical protein
MPRCRFCDADVPAGRTSCPSCGAELPSDDPTTATPAATAPIPSGAEDETELLDLLRRGRKIDAIKLHRQRTGAGLKEAKDAVEALAVRNGLPASGPGCLGAALLMAATSVAAALLL